MSPSAAGFLAEKIDDGLAGFAGEGDEGAVDGVGHSLLDRVAYTLGDPPQVTFKIDGGVAAIGPVVFAVIVDGGFVDDDGAVSAGMGAVVVDIVGEEQNALGVAAADGVWADAWRHVFPAGFMATLGDHDKGVAIREFAVFDATRFAFDFQADDEAKGFAKPVDGLGGIIIKEGRG